MRMAGRFSRRLRAWAKANGIPVIYCSPGEDKHKMAEEHLAVHETKPGLFMILVSKAPAPVWQAQMTGSGKLGRRAEGSVAVCQSLFLLYLGSAVGSPDDQNEWSPAIRGASDSEWSRIRGLSGPKSRRGIH